MIPPFLGEAVGTGNGVAVDVIVGVIGRVAVDVGIPKVAVAASVGVGVSVTGRWIKSF
jgi:hypothetical protein